MKISVSCVSSGTKCIPTGITRCFRGPERQRVPGVHQLYTLFFSSCLGLVIELRKMARLQVERRLRLCDPEVATANSSWELAVGSSSKGKPTVTRAMAVGTPHRQMKPLSMYN